jgi:hypothetical protein
VLFTKNQKMLPEFQLCNSKRIEWEVFKRAGGEKVVGGISLTVVNTVTNQKQSHA